MRGISGVTDGQDSAGNTIAVVTPEAGTLVLLGSAWIGFWGVRRKIMK